MNASATRRALQRIAVPLRSWSRAGWVATTVGSLALLLGGAAWLVRLGWLTSPWWVFAAWGVAALASVVLVRLAWLGEGHLTLPHLTPHLEELGGWRRGSLTALLDTPAPGTSGTLLDAADRRGAADLDARGFAAVAPLHGQVRARAAGGIVCLALGLAALSSAGPVGGAAAALWHPRRAWDMVMAPVTLRASAPAVDRGRRVELAMQAMGRRQATLWLRAPGEAWRAKAMRLDSLGRATESVSALQSDLFARVTSGGKSSDTVVVRIRLPVFLGSLAVTARYPAYLGLEDEPMPTGGDTLLLPAGTRLDTQGEATAALKSASWLMRHSTARRLEVETRRFAGSFTPQASGEYRLALVTADGVPLAGDTVRLPVRVLPDRPPLIEITVPGADTTAPVSLQVPLVIDVQDDHGVSSVIVESRRVTRFGVADSALREAVAVPPDHPDRAIVSFGLDLNRRGLLPGDTLRYSARALDNAPAPQATRSREYVLRLPTMSEIRALRRQATDNVAGQLDSITAESKRLERQAQDLAQEQPRAGRSRDDRTSDALPFEEAKKAEAVAQAQQQLIQEAELLKESLEALQRSAEAAGVADSAWQQQLREIRDQLERAISPELRERLAELQAALKDLSAERTRDALDRLAEAQRNLREALERSRELFRRAALEGDLASLSQESRDLKREQERWNDQVHAADSARATVTEQQLADRADSLAAALSRAGEQMSREREGQKAAKDQQDIAGKLDAAQKRAGRASHEMKQAEKSASTGQRDKAQERGEQAARTLEPLSRDVEQAREQMSQQWREEVLNAIDRALTETSRLTERQLGVEQAFRSGAPASAVRADQAAVEEGVQRLLDQLQSTSGKNALVSSEPAVALAEARQQMEQARDAVSSAIPNPRAAAEQAGAAVDAMNLAAHQLMRARGNVSGSASGSGLAEALEQMARLASEQGKLGQQSGGLLPMAGGGGMQQQLRELAARQRALAERLERMRGQGDIPGAGEMANEAQDLARRLEAGQLDRQTVQRQERLFRRMLDAGRTLQGHERDEKKERQSTTATGDSVRVPGALRKELLDDDSRLRVPSWEELQRLSPEERRLVVDYFRRLSESSAR